MKRHARLLLLVVAVGSIFGMLATPPAHAHTDACGGNGIAVLDGIGFGLPVVHGNRTANFNFSLGLGACVSGRGLGATGFVNGACGQSSGYGITDTGHRFAFVSTGGTMHLTGQVTGHGVIVEDQFDAPSCVSGNARRFAFTGEVVLTHTATCTVTVVATIKPNLSIYGCSGA